MGCQPSLTYEELNEGAKTDPKIAKRLETFEKDAEKAEIFFEEKRNCQLIWSCSVRQRNLEQRPIEDIDDLVKVYRHERTSCRCESFYDAIGSLR